MKRVTCFMLSLALAIPLCCPVVFADVFFKDSEPEYTYIEIDSEQEANITAIEENVILGSNDYVYKTVYADIHRKTVGGYPDNQPEEGVCFPTGGAIFYTDAGGTSISTGISVTFPDSLVRWVSLSINIGVTGSSGGVMVKVPRTDAYYKLYVEKTVEFQPYVTYKRLKGAAHADDWSVYITGCVKLKTVDHKYIPTITKFA